MAKKFKCSVCKIEAERGITVDTSRSAESWGDELEVHRTTITRHLGHAPFVPSIDDALAGDAKSPGYSKDEDENSIVITKRSERIIPLSEWLDDLRDDGHDPADFDCSIGHSVWMQHTAKQETKTLYANRFSAVRRIKKGSAPEWPVIQQATPVSITSAQATVTVPRIGGLKLAMKSADHQIGFRALGDGPFDPFHDAQAMALFVEACRLYQPDKIQLLGDVIDLPSQSRWAQEAGFARTTQKALDVTHRHLAELRAACPAAEIIVIEGNHDKRMQTFIESNALAAFGLKRAAMPESWPVMSLPHLLRLDELDVRYIDAYPAATDWDNDTTRNIHGTKASSRGSTTSQYVFEAPHISTWAGHSHRAEITYHSVIGPRGEAIESYSANPGCMCRTDGAVPSVNGAIGADGTAARVVENWQQGFGMLYYNDAGESWPQVHRIKNGRAIVDGRVLEVPILAAA